MSSIVSNILQVKNNIAIAAKKSGRNSNDINLVCVTKQVPIESIKEAISAGIKVVGESRVDEAISKKEKIHDNIRWHLVGHLQSRKVKDAVRIFDLIHSVDTVDLAEEINKRAGSIGKIQDILLEVNISGEVSKYGFKTEDVIPSLKLITDLPNVKILGLMTMAPLVDNPELTRPVFRGLKELADKIGEEGVKIKYLSMGMTQDYMVAIEEGSNMVRIGTAIFGG